MNKTYCDICGDELVGKNMTKGGHMVESRLGVTIEREDRKFRFEVLVSEDGVSNKGDICKYCVLDALHGLDDRPTASNRRG